MEGVNVRLVKIRKQFPSLVAVDDVSMTVPEGSFFSILGPSGGGKSTLLRIISGFERPDSGELYIGGKLVNDIPPNKRRTNLVFQHLALFPTMNVAQNIAFGLKRQGLAKADITKKISKVLALVDLKKFEQRKIHMLSGGQKQRVALARCLVLDPTVLLLDEPLGALDLKLRESMKLVLKRLQARVGTTFIYVTHDQSEALTMSNMIAVINKGHIEQISNPLELFYHPKSYFTATFIGDNNRWDGHVKSINKNGNCTVQIGGRSFEAVMGEEMVPEDKVSMFVRPEMLRIGVSAQSEEIRGKVKEVVFDGTYTRVLLNTMFGDQEMEILVKVAQSEDPLALKEGDVLSVCLKKGIGTVFLHRELQDAQTEL